MNCKRYTLLLALLDALGGQATRLEFQKLLFLFCQEDSAPLYEFVPYKYGAFSFTSYADQRRLEAQGLLKTNAVTLLLTPQGAAWVRATAASQRTRIRAFVERYEGVRGDTLIADTYRRFPYYATRSEMAGRILAGDPGALKQIEAARPVQLCPRVYTIGYEGRSLEGYLNMLLRAGVHVLCDVRRNAMSRKYGFSKKTLAQACEGVGIAYQHIAELGIASEERQALQTADEYQQLFRRYEQEYLPRLAAYVKRIAAMIAGGRGVALTCYERDAGMCHRHYVAEAVCRALRPRMEPVHL